jgi:hypothetical protein
MAFSFRKTGHFLSADACVPEQFTQWGELGHDILTVPTDKVRSTPLPSVSTLLALVAPCWIRNVQVNWNCFIPNMDGCRKGRHLRSKKKCMKRE